MCEKLEEFPAWIRLLQQGLELACDKKCTIDLVQASVETIPKTSMKQLKGSEPLMNALENSHLKCAKVLIQSTEIDPQYVDQYGRGYRHRLVRAQVEQEHVKIFEILFKDLLDLGINVNLKDCLGESPLDFCVRNIATLGVNGELGSAYFSFVSFLRNRVTTKHASALLCSCLVQKLTCVLSRTDIQIAEKLITNIVIDFPREMEKIFYTPLPDLAHPLLSDKAFARYLTLFEMTDELRSLLGVIISQHCESIVISILRNESVRISMRHLSTWTNFLQRGLELACKLGSCTELVKAFATAQLGDAVQKLDGSMAFLCALVTLNK